uniref:C2H2-type domain-containing protein n=1 Tax=Nothoprocta perdicaria TaxID=30464 RepID=A0A8C7A2A5_NOTPE
MGRTGLPAASGSGARGRRHDQWIFLCAAGEAAGRGLCAGRPGEKRGKLRFPQKEKNPQKNGFRHEETAAALAHVTAPGGVARGLGRGPLRGGAGLRGHGVTVVAPGAACPTPDPPAAPGSPCTARPAAGDPHEVDEDEGIHSHEGSDISDNISEGSDDSGLNGARSAPEDAGPKGPPGAGAAAGTFVCIFCDRGFGREGEYSKHLNRHLVNVYYLEKATQGQE